MISNKINTDIFFSPSKIKLIERTDIENKNGETLGDILQLAGGVMLKAYGGNGSLNTISTNGLGAEHTLVLLNGFKLNSAQNAQIDLSTISKDFIERIEVMNNGSSSLYGSEAMGGVVNIITKNISGKNLYFKLNGEFGSHSQRKISVEAGKELRNINFNINFSKETSLNNYDYFFNNGAEKIKKERFNSNYKIDAYSFNVNFKIHSHSKLNLLTYYNELMRNLPGIEAGSEPSKSNQTDHNWNSIISYENVLTKNIDIKSQINFQNNLSHYINTNVSNSFYKNINISNSAQINYSKKHFEIIPGYEISYASLKSNEIEDNTRRVQAGLFIVSQFKPNTSIKFFPSIRYDHISDIKKNVFSGKLGINFNPVKHLNWNLKSSIGNNFASPTFNELYWKDLGNKQLKPESSVNFDAGSIIGFDLYSKNLLEITYTFIEAKDKIVWSPNNSGIWSPANIGRSVSNTFMIEVSAAKRFLKNLNLKFGLIYSYTSSIKKSIDFPGDPSYDKQIFYIPKELAKYNLSIKYKESGLNIFYSFTGKRFTDFENINFLPAVDLLELNIYHKVKMGNFLAGIKFELNNVFNEDYQIISGYPMPLRNFKFNFSFEY
ncbi:MAG: TonB-dependent receptor [Ignavibacteria bacterium]